MSKIAVFGLLAIFALSVEGGYNVVDVYGNIVFDAAVMKNIKPVVVFYYSSSECAACKWSIKPLLEKMARKKDGKLFLATLDFDKVPDFKGVHGIREMPTTRLFYKGKVLAEVEGLSWAKLVTLMNNVPKIVFEHQQEQLEKAASQKKQYRA